MPTRKVAIIMILTLILVIISGLFLFYETSKENYNFNEPIEGSLCYSTNGCPEGYRCYDFEDPSIENPVCLKSDPCKICPSRECLITNESPNKVVCIE